MKWKAKFLPNSWHCRSVPPQSRESRNATNRSLFAINACASRHDKLDPRVPRRTPNRRTLPRFARILSPASIAFTPGIRHPFDPPLPQIPFIADESIDVLERVACTPVIGLEFRYEAEAVFAVAAGDRKIVRTSPTQPIVDHVKNEPIARSHRHI